MRKGQGGSRRSQEEWSGRWGEVAKSRWWASITIDDTRTSDKGKLTKTWKQIQAQCARNPGSPLKSMPPEASRPMAMDFPTGFLALLCTLHLKCSMHYHKWKCFFEGERPSPLLKPREIWNSHTANHCPCWTFLQRSHKVWFCGILLEYYPALNLWHAELARLDTWTEAGWSCTLTTLNADVLCCECSQLQDK